MINILCKTEKNEIVLGNFKETCVYQWKEYVDYFNGFYLNSDSYSFLFKLPSFPKYAALDLFYLSIFVYYADKKVSRKIFFDGWTREIRMHVPVLELDKMNSVKEILEKTISFLTGDSWQFVFRSRDLNHRESFVKRKLERERSIFNQGLNNVDCISMLSGGLDSFIGASDLLSMGINPIFVSHHDSGAGELKFQEKVIEKLVEKYKVNENRFMKFCQTVRNGVELTTRSRSFMFFSHAILIGSCFDKSLEVYIPENGFIALNVPFVPSRNGSNSTRTTHPYYLSNLNIILNKLEIGLRLKNPYKFMTKGEMLLGAIDKEFVEEFAKITMSCSHPTKNRWSKQGDHIHCGDCLPCIIRKASFKKAEMTDSTYKDTLLKDGKALSNFRIYQNGLAIYNNTDSKIKLLQSGPIDRDLPKYIEVYEKGMEEVRKVIKEIEDNHNA